MKPRDPQLLLRLEADTPEPTERWCAGAEIIHHGLPLRLALDTSCREPTRMADELHLPLPPAATARQIRDAAESWLRDEAQRTFSTFIARKSALTGRQAPKVTLTFGKRSDWVRVEGDSLRCHWRLIEQPATIIEQVLGLALASLQPAPVCDDLFAMV